MAVRLGRRAIKPLLEKLNDPDKAVRGAAANALMQLGDSRAIQRISQVGQA
jgi:HEAT repeat protein